MARRGKGSSFERDVARQLSLWASYGEADDWYWRSSQSGGRATTRFMSQGKRTAGHHGDLAPTCREAHFFTDKITIELKRGYNHVTVADLLDRPKQLKQQGLEAFVEQAVRAALGAGTKHWLVVHKRDLREPLAYLPGRLYSALFPEDARNKSVVRRPVAWVWTNLKLKNGDTQRLRLAVVHWEAFLDACDPESVRAL